MNRNKNINPIVKLNKFVLITTPSDEVTIEIYVRNETIWANHSKNAESFGVEKSAIIHHIEAACTKGKLEKTAASSNFAQVRGENKTGLKSNIKNYILDTFYTLKRILPFIYESITSYSKYCQLLTGCGKLLKSLNIEPSSTIFAPIVPAKPLYNAQIGRSSFFIGLCFLLLIKHSL
jgi:hypothetical protein